MMKLIRTDGAREFCAGYGYDTWVAVDGMMEVPDGIATKMLATGLYAVAPAPAPKRVQPKKDQQQEAND